MASKFSFASARMFATTAMRSSLGRIAFEGVNFRALIASFDSVMINHIALWDRDLDVMQGAAAIKLDGLTKSGRSAEFDDGITGLGGFPGDHDLIVVSGLMGHPNTFDFGVKKESCASSYASMMRHVENGEHFAGRRLGQIVGKGCQDWRRFAVMRERSLLYQ
jgi:hypothetical protein